MSWLAPQRFAITRTRSAAAGRTTQAFQATLQTSPECGAAECGAVAQLHEEPCPASAVLKNLPHVKHVFDRFHIVKLMNEKLNEHESDR